MKKIRWLLIILLITSVATVLLVVAFYHKQEHMILTKKFYISINKEINISYFENNNSDNPYCYAALKVNDQEYIKILHDMEKADYYIFKDFNELYLQRHNNWMNSKNIVQAYVMDTVEYSFISGHRVHIYIFITDSQNGYRDIYMLRN